MIWLNSAAAALSVLAAVLISVAPTASVGEPARFRRAATNSTEILERDGQRGLLDATGHFVPIRDYQRILSGSSITDGMLRALCEPTRVLYYTAYSANPETFPFAYQYAGKLPEVGLDATEAVIAMRPDLLLVHNIGNPERVTRLREAGIEIFDFGEMRGLATLVPNLRALGALLGRPEAGDALARRFPRRLANIAAHIPEDRRPRAMYLGIYGDKLYGGTKGTSFYDVLTAAGLVDAAARDYVNWPAFTSEQLLQLDPQVIVTHEGMEAPLCQHPGLSRLSACGPGGRIVGMHSGLIESPGLAMLDAAETLYEFIHTPQPHRNHD